jgi:uncharacterized membrane protein (UPF0127 family)
MIFEAAVLVFAAATAAPAPIPTPQSLPRIALRAPSAVLKVQVARTAAQRERGLMGVTRLPKHTGMLFIFDRDEPVAFWMKDTLIPLDMVFAGENGVVRRVYRSVPVVPPAEPDGQIPLERGTAKYVIELPANEAAADGLRPGAIVEGLPHP